MCCIAPFAPTCQITTDGWRRKRVGFQARQHLQHVLAADAAVQHGDMGGRQRAVEFGLQHGRVAVGDVGRMPALGGRDCPGRRSSPRGSRRSPRASAAARSVAALPAGHDARRAPRLRRLSRPGQPAAGPKGPRRGKRRRDMLRWRSRRPSGLDSFNVGWPTPTGTPWPFLPQVPMPGSRPGSLPTISILVSASGPLPISVAPLTGAVTRPSSIR